ncbi:MAG: alanyl-tRNA editing protein [Chloroflexi bacterium]|nr:alanyl-tRNA editing protein [Chloroflexota bacterium]
MTTAIYLTDAYCREIRATVVAHAGSAVVLDRTVFFPGGGGQPADVGTLVVSGVARPVVQVRRSDDGAVLHDLDPADGPAPAVGTPIVAAIDWPHRYRLMRTHTAMHVLCGAIFRAFGALVTGGQMYLDRARMDFELDDLSADRVTQIEAMANEDIAADRPVRVFVLPRAEAFAIPDLIRTKINLLPEGIREVRIVEIVGLDVQADGGTHVARTGEIGGLRVIGTRSKGRINKRLEIALVD